MLGVHCTRPFHPLFGGTRHAQTLLALGLVLPPFWMVSPPSLPTGPTELYAITWLLLLLVVQQVQCQL